MKKIAFILFMILTVPFCAVYAQDCSDLIQGAGRMYDKYKTTYNPDLLKQAKKQLENIQTMPGAPEKCKEQAAKMLKEMKPVVKPSVKKSNVEVAQMVVHVDTVVQRHVKIDSVVNVVFQFDSLKAKQFYETVSAGDACMERKDYDCVVEKYLSAIAYGRDMQMGEDVLADYQDKVERTRKLQFNSLLNMAKQKEDEGRQNGDVKSIREALKQYQELMTYGSENGFMTDAMKENFEKKIDYLEIVELMYEYVEQGNEYFSARAWELARSELTTAVALSDSLGWKRGRIFWQQRIDTINHILSASSVVSDYATLNKQAYNKMGENLTNVLQESLLRFNEVPADTMSVQITVSPEGNSDVFVDLKREDSLLVNVVKEGVEKSPYQLPAVLYFGQPSLAQANYRYTVSVNSAIATVKRTPKRTIENEPILIGLNDIETFIQKTEDTTRRMEFTKDCAEFLYGKFYFKQSVANVNNTTRSGFHLVKYSGTGGPANALLSLVIPGLGRHRVTYGKQNGVATAVCFYLCTGAALGCYGAAFDPHIQGQKYEFKDYMGDLKKFFNVKQNWQYLKDISVDAEGNPINGQDRDMTDIRRTEYVCALSFAGIAATLYVTDVLYTLIRGSVNVARQNKYKKWSVGVFYDPSSKTPVLQYNYKIKSHR